MPSFRPDYLLRLRFGSAEITKIRRLAEARGRQQQLARQYPEQIERLRARAILESTDPTGVRPQEIAGYRDALQLIHQTHASIPFSVNVVLQLHQMLYRHRTGGGGRWKQIDSPIVERDEHGRPLRVRFDPMPAALAPHAMADLTDGYRHAANAGIADPLVLVPLAVLDFLCVHPFADGNGRIARLLSLLLLYKLNYCVGRYVGLERIIAETREQHDAALERSSEGWHHNAHDPQPWLAYYWDVLIRAYDEFESRVSAMQETKTEQIRAAVLRRRPHPFGIAEIEQDCPRVSRDMVRHVLRQMRAEGIVRVDGRGRGAKWAARS